ncbi:spore protein H [Bacillus fungorum]|uniref:spore protein H n=1 Tax=Bacillus fungorum TaxID=2039284 RepID=UPI0033967222
MARRQKDRIVRVQFAESHVMMFGNSYKTWEEQLDEYLWLLKRDGELNSVKGVTVSDNKWVSWGGLKWCPENKFQHQLNREGCQSDEPDNPNPRQYKDMKFYPDVAVANKVIKAAEKYKNNIY